METLPCQSICGISTGRCLVVDYKLRLIDMMGLNGMTIPDKAQVFVADDIRYLMDADPTFDNSITLPPETYGIVAPPFDTFWVEARTDITFFENNLNLLDAISAATITVQTLDEARDSLHRNTNFFTVNKPEAYEAKWVYFIKAHKYEHYQDVGKHLYISTHTAVLPIGEDGIALFDDDGVAVSAIEHSKLDLLRIQQSMYQQNSQNPEYYHHILPAEMVASIIPLVLRTVSALHRKSDILQVNYPKSYRKRMQRKHGYTPRNNYYLRVGDNDMPRRTFQGVSVSVNRRNKTRTHYRAGHFKYYSEDKPHVSGLTGMMWVNSTMVHPDRDEQITKRYKVKGQKNESK